MDITKIRDITKNIDYHTTYTTCYRDANDELIGKLYIDENIYIDFDESDIFCDSESFGFTASEMKVIKKLIINESSYLTADALGKARYGDPGYLYCDCDQMVQNVKTKILKKIREAGNLEAGDSKKGFIKNKSKEGYRVDLPKKIYRFNEIKKSDGYSAKDLFCEAYDNNCDDETKSNAHISEAFSQKFLHSGAQKLFDATGDVVLSELSKLSTIFSHISTVDNKATVQTDVIKDIYGLVVDGCHNDFIKDVLKIKGPLGSYKNRIMQYLYLAITKNNKDILPFYIDIAFYERIAESNIQVSEDEIIARIDKDFDDIQKIVIEDKNRTPLVFLDGIRDFSRGNESLYNSINTRIIQLSELNCKLVICLDADFTVNNQHQFNVHPLGSEYFAHYMRIKPMTLHKKEESIEFIKNCIEISSFKFPVEISAEKVYENLIRLNFSSIDAYWLIYILKTASKYFFDVKGNIADLYTAICIEILGNAKLIDSASELAYEFEFGAADTNDTNLYYDIRWRLIRKHRSVLDFLIAKQYIKKVSGLNLIKGNTEHNEKSLKFFNMVLQKNITRFVVAMLKGVDDYEHQIMIIAKHYYDMLSLFGKSELTFWMARLDDRTNKTRKYECIRLLKGYNKQEIPKYDNISSTNIIDKRNAAFLIRGINVSLIYENDREALEYYLNSLLTDKIANSVNRGFHLEYYGDKSYIPNKSLLDYEDDITKGEKTLTVLCLSLDKRIKRRDVSSYVAALEVMTICNLIQARIEQTQNDNVLDVTPYIAKCLRYLDWIIEQGQKIIRGLTNVAMYFMWMRNELHNLVNENISKDDKPVRYYHSTPFNKFSLAKTIERTGWVNSDIPKPENIVEHMYNCWLIGMLYLPDHYSEQGYNKSNILQMLLIHDLGETETGDINRPEKLMAQHNYDFQENMVMQSLLLSGTYPGSVNLSSYIEHWNSWDRKDGINYYIAKDIDNIQTIYQFCYYYNQYPEKFTTDDVCYWLSGINRLESELGKEISEKLIKNNPLYSNIMGLFYDNSDDIC